VLIVVRHGQTDVNARGLLLGRSDPPLDAAGRKQASAVAAELAPLSKTTRVISSPLRRTRETAAIIARDGPVEIDERWVELDYGAFEGKPLLDITQEEWDRWRSDPDFAPEGGETLRSLGQRVAEACTELLAAGIDDDVIVVTHVSPVKAALVWALDVGDHVTWRTYVAPGSITRIANRPHGPVLVAFNETPWTTSGGVSESASRR
jgi:probable phosphoglycerate mutase